MRVDEDDAEYHSDQRPGKPGPEVLEDAEEQKETESDGDREMMSVSQTGKGFHDRAEEPVFGNLHSHQSPQLPRDDTECNPVQITRQDRPRQEVRDDPQPSQASGDTEQAGNERQGDCHIHVTGGIAGNQRTDCRRDDGAGGRIGIHHQLSRRAKQRVGHGREYRRVDARDRREPGKLGVGDADRKGNRGQRDAGEQIALEPFSLVGPDDPEAWHPAFEGWGGQCGFQIEDFRLKIGGEDASE